MNEFDHVEYLDDLAESFEASGGNDGFIDTLKILACAREIERLRKRWQWKAVSDELPPEYEKVIGFRSDLGFAIAYRFTHRDGATEWNWNGVSGGTEFQRAGRTPQYWCLPEPPDGTHVEG